MRDELQRTRNPSGGNVEIDVAVFVSSSGVLVASRTAPCSPVAVGGICSAHYVDVPASAFSSVSAATTPTVQLDVRYRFTNGGGGGFSSADGDSAGNVTLHTSGNYPPFFIVVSNGRLFLLVGGMAVWRAASSHHIHTFFSLTLAFALLSLVVVSFLCLS